MKKWSIFVIGMILLTFIFGQVSKLYYKDSGLSDMCTYEDILKLDAKIDYIFGDTKEDEVEKYRSLIEYEEDYVKEVDNASFVAVVTPTGNYSQNGYSFGQEVKINQVLKGVDVYENDLVYVYDTEGFRVDNSYKVVYLKTRNVLLHNYEYLIFINPLKLSKYGDKEYSWAGGYFSYLRLSDGTDYAIEKPVEELTFNELSELEYFASTNRLLEQIAKIKQRILENYMEK